MNPAIKTLKVRVKDKHIKLLLDMAKQVNFVWNYINELSSRSIYEKRKWSCNKCGTVHDRDINAALNIATHGHFRAGWMSKFNISGNNIKKTYGVIDDI